MENPAWLFGLIGLILGGGGIGALLPLLKIKQDRDSSMVVGSEIAVQSLMTALKNSDTRVTHLEEENESLKIKLDQLKAEVDAAITAVHALTEELNLTRAKLNRALNSDTSPNKKEEF